jgi:hypothetical protein
MTIPDGLGTMAAIGEVYCKTPPYPVHRLTRKVLPPKG